MIRDEWHVAKRGEGKGRAGRVINSTRIWWLAFPSRLIRSEFVSSNLVRECPCFRLSRYPSPHWQDKYVFRWALYIHCRRPEDWKVPYYFTAPRPDKENYSRVIHGCYPALVPPYIYKSSHEIRIIKRGTKLGLQTYLRDRYRQTAFPWVEYKSLNVKTTLPL